MEHDRALQSIPDDEFYLRSERDEDDIIRAFDTVLGG
jgi:hypothetical protein